MTRSSLNCREYRFTRTEVFHNDIFKLALVGVDQIVCKERRIEVLELGFENERERRVIRNHVID